MIIDIVRNWICGKIIITIDLLILGNIHFKFDLGDTIQVKLDDVKISLFLFVKDALTKTRYIPRISST